MLIELDHIQIERATYAGARVTMKAIRGGYKDTGTKTDDMTRFEQHFRAAKAEIAVSLFTGLPWLSEENDWTHDVGELEVRSIEWDARPALRASWKDERHDPSQQFVLARVDGRWVEILGWSTLAKIRREGTTKQWGQGLHWYLDHAQLYKPETLLA